MSGGAIGLEHPTHSARRARRIPADRLLPVGALIGALGVGLALVRATGVPVHEALAAFWDGIAGSPFALVGSVARGVPLALVGLGFILAERANLTNVGGEGQICLGGILATAASLSWGAARLPGPLAFLFPLVAGTAGGALWGAIAGFLKAKRGSNEVITTLLLTFIALQMVYGSVQSVHLLRQPMTDSATLPESLELPAVTQLPVLTGSSELPLHIGLVIEVLAAVAVGVCLARSAVGLRLRAVGQNELASRRAGLPVERLVVGALAASGALGGLAGAIMIQGDQHYLTAGFSSGFGFDGLVVGLLGRGSATAVVAFALLFGCLRSGGMSMEMSASVPSAVVVVCQGVMVVAMAIAAALARRKVGVMALQTLQVFVSSTLRLATPLLLAATGEMVSEQAGVLNLSLEGMMLTAAFMGAFGAKLTGSPMAGLLLGLAAALLLAAAQAILSVRVRANQLVVGIGFNIFALGATTFLYREIFGGLSREVLPSFQIVEVPLLSRVPFLGGALFAQTGLVYVAFALVAVTWWVVEKTPFGLAVRAVGENPRAADQAGIPVTRVRFLAVLYAGACAGLAGVFLSVASISTFTEGMTSGAGYLAVTAVILGGWRSGACSGRACCSAPRRRCSSCCRCSACRSPPRGW